MPEVHKAAIALGSNLSSSLGGPEDNVRAAVARIGALGKLVAVSTLLRTAPEIYTQQPEFINAALILETELAPLELMRALLEIEHSMGRTRTNVPPKGPRVIDLDLIFYDDVILETPALTLPHPAVAMRSFVLRPLAEIAPHWEHPQTHQNVGEMLAQLHPQT